MKLFRLIDRPLRRSPP